MTEQRNEPEKPVRNYLAYTISTVIGVPLTSIFVSILAFPAIAAVFYFNPQTGLAYLLMAVIAVSLGIKYANNIEKKEEPDSFMDGARMLQNQLMEVDINVGVITLAALLAVSLVLYFNLLVLTSISVAYFINSLIGAVGFGFILGFWVPVFDGHIAGARGIAPILALTVLPMLVIVLAIGIFQMMLVGRSNLIDNFGILIQSIIKSVTDSRQGGTSKLNLLF
jgi:hypothetical protein